jgi:hypothetical protein
MPCLNPGCGTVAKMLRLTLVAVLLIVLAVPAAALAVTRYGDRGVNRLNGGPNADRLYGLGGNDRLSGRGAADRLVGRHRERPDLRRERQRPHRRRGR